MMELIFSTSKVLESEKGVGEDIPHHGCGKPHAKLHGANAFFERKHMLPVPVEAIDRRLRLRRVVEDRRALALEFGVYEHEGSGVGRGGRGGAHGRTFASSGEYRWTWARTA